MKISGHVDLCGPELIEGWLYCDAWEGEPIKLQVFIGDALLGECEADRFRNDLQEAGFGDGRCGFSFMVPEGGVSFNFAETRLRLLETPVFLLPDEFSNVSNQPGASAPGGFSVTENPPNYLAPLQVEASGSGAKGQPGRARSTGRSFHHTS
jgi:hypothetical protein